ncbi:hypothetical protein [Streptacidiphilus carbonis]|jgi:hypothetical protein|uniref:hypothetical protein n=1 Tax=Streptacidiphilus carbonis TaxID=105422 RepID=UPI0005A5F2B8|nr:hypothetical protein [Streptacidiphilus carbonis]
MERSVKGASALAAAAAILSAGATSASAATASPHVFCRTGAAKASLVKISDEALAVGAAACSGESNS